MKTTVFQDKTIFGNGGDDGGGIRYHLLVQGNPGVKVLVDDDDTKYDPEGSIAVSDDQWHHIVGMRDGTSLRLYIDGVEDPGLTAHDESTIATADYDISGASQYNAYIGAIITNNTGDFHESKFFNGLIDEVALWNRALTVDQISYLYNDGAGRPVIEPVSSYKAVAASKGFVLQNYPNPFSSLTTFSFQLPENSHTKLVVCNSFGQEVAVLVNGMRPAGIYKEQFDGSGLPDGVYYARLQTDLYSKTIKISLTK